MKFWWEVREPALLAPTHSSPDQATCCSCHEAWYNTLFPAQVRVTQVHLVKQETHQDAFQVTFSQIFPAPSIRSDETHDRNKTHCSKGRRQQQEQITGGHTCGFAPEVRLGNLSMARGCLMKTALARCSRRWTSTPPPPITWRLRVAFKILPPRS